MIFTCLKSELSKAVTTAQKATATKSSMPILEGILFEIVGGILTVSGYDLEIFITTAIEVTATEPGKIVLNARLFSEIVKKLPDENVKIETNNNNVFVSSGTASYNLISMDANEYPAVPEFERERSAKISGKVLKEMIKGTIYSVSTNMAKPIFTGSLFEFTKKQLKIVAVDGYRLAIRQEAIDCDMKDKIVIPAKTQNEIVKLMADKDEVEINIGQRHVEFIINDYTVITRLVEGTFMDYKKTISKNPKTFVHIGTRQLLETIERMAVIDTDSRRKPIECNISENQITFDCKQTIGKAHEVLDAEATGEDVTIGFNSHYFMDAIKNTPTDEIKLEIEGSHSPMLVRPLSGDNFLSIVVPMRLERD